MSTLLVNDIAAPQDDYLAFIERKIKIDAGSGFEVPMEDINPALKLFNRKAVQWALRGGRRALFFSFGLHKTCMQLEKMRLIGKYRPCRRLIILPLGVRQEFFADAAEFFQDEYSINLKFIQKQDEFEGDDLIYLTNYESVRDRKIDVTAVGAIDLDEADCLRSFGSQTFSEFVFGPVQEVPLRGVNTATPSPNDYQELLAYSHFLGVMEIGEARTRFFQRNSEQADDLTLLPHMEEEFWLWVSSWALFVGMPSDLGDCDEGYDLPELDIHFHEVPSEHRDTSGRVDKRGQKRLLKEEAIGVVDEAREKRESLPARLAKLLELRELDPSAHRLLWHDMEDERIALEKAIPGLRTVYGKQRDEDKESAILGFRSGEISELAAKSVMLGGGCNFQRHCHWHIFMVVGFKFRDFIQAIHRLLRFGQKHKVRVDIIFSTLQRPVLETLLRKWKQHDAMVKRMRAIVREHKLSNASLIQPLKQSIGVTREEVRGEMYLAVLNDTVLETRAMESDSVGQILTSPPFSNQYRYSANFNDFGHNAGMPGFLEQMEFLTPELYRILMPGRVACIHVKDRIVPGEMIGQRYQTVDPFHAHVLLHFMRHGFTFLGMMTVVTDVVKENNGTYRLSYTQQLKDGSRMGFGLPEYVLVFRKPPTDTTKGYADCPIEKSLAEYPLSQWQIDAHGFWRSSGDRYLEPDDLQRLKWSEIIRLYRDHSANSIYDFALEKRIAQAVDEDGNLPRDFMLLQPQSWHPDVWTDVMRAKTYNANQVAKGRERHLCPLQHDIVDRLIERYSNPSDVVYDCFAGIFTTPARAVRKGRFGVGTELSAMYWRDGAGYCKAEEEKVRIPSLFDLIDDHQEVLAA